MYQVNAALSQTPVVLTYQSRWDGRLGWPEPRIEQLTECATVALLPIVLHRPL